MARLAYDYVIARIDIFIKQLEADIAMRLDDEESLKAILQDVYKMDQLQSDLGELDGKIKSQENTLSLLGKKKHYYCLCCCGVVLLFYCIRNMSINMLGTPEVSWL